MSGQRDIVERLKAKAPPPSIEWHVANPEDGAYCIAFGAHEGNRAREWLAEHRRNFPRGRFAGYEVVRVVVPNSAGDMLREAADEIERLRAEAARYRDIGGQLATALSQEVEQLRRRVKNMRAFMEGFHPGLSDLFDAADQRIAAEDAAPRAGEADRPAPPSRAVDDTLTSTPWRFSTDDTPAATSIAVFGSGSGGGGDFGGAGASGSWEPSSSSCSSSSYDSGSSYSSSSDSSSSCDSSSGSD